MAMDASANDRVSQYWEAAEDGDSFFGAEILMRSKRAESSTWLPGFRRDEVWRVLHRSSTGRKVRAAAHRRWSRSLT